jgi:hypothetical protein
MESATVLTDTFHPRAGGAPGPSAVGAGATSSACTRGEP